MLLFSNNKEDYPFGTFKSLPTRYRPLVGAENCHDLVISGKGKMDGQGEPWWQAHRALGTKVKDPTYADPHCFLAITSANFLQPPDLDTARSEVQSCLDNNPPAQMVQLVQSFAESLDASTTTTSP